ncbi:MAG: sugar ABC transporter permease, partial [Proteobacteria bacterium]|nr:sugar ABC transporter permease [Pseudomonadota bacterium]
MTAVTAARRPVLGRAVADFDRQRRAFFAWCLAPALAVLIVVTLLPTVYMLLTSLTPLNLTNPAT